MYAGNLHENVTESDLVELFGLMTTNYLIDNCSIEMSNLQQNGSHNGHAFILALVMFDQQNMHKMTHH